MKNLLKSAGVLLLFFVAMFLITATLGLSNADHLLQYVQGMVGSHFVLSSLLVVLLLWIDIVLSIPTMVLSVTAGNVFGVAYASLLVFLGLQLAGITGYVLSKRLGVRFLALVVRDSDAIREMKVLFHRQGVWLLVFCRIVPLAPEICCCLSGITGLPFRKFFGAWSVSSATYAVAITYAGSVASIEEPWELLGIVGAFLAVLGSGYALASRYVDKQTEPPR